MRSLKVTFLAVATARMPGVVGCHERAVTVSFSLAAYLNDWCSSSLLLDLSSSTTGSLDRCSSAKSSENRSIVAFCCSTVETAGRAPATKAASASGRTAAAAAAAAALTPTAAEAAREPPCAEPARECPREAMREGAFEACRLPEADGAVDSSGPTPSSSSVRARHCTALFRGRAHVVCAAEEAVSGIACDPRS